MKLESAFLITLVVLGCKTADNGSAAMPRDHYRSAEDAAYFHAIDVKRGTDRPHVEILGWGRCMTFTATVVGSNGVAVPQEQVRTEPDSVYTTEVVPLDDGLNEYTVTLKARQGREGKYRIWKAPGESWYHGITFSILQSGEMWIGRLRKENRPKTTVEDFCTTEDRAAMAEREAQESRERAVQRQAEGERRRSAQETELRGMAGSYAFRASCTQGSIRPFTAEVAYLPTKGLSLYPSLTIRGIGRELLHLPMVNSVGVWKINPESLTVHNLISEGDYYTLDSWMFAPRGDESRIGFRIYHDVYRAEADGRSTQRTLYCTLDGSKRG